MQDPKPVGGESPLSIPFLTESIPRRRRKSSDFGCSSVFREKSGFPGQANAELTDKKGRIFNKDGLLFCLPFGRLCFADYCSLNSLDALSSNREGSVDWGPPISRFSLRAHCPRLSNRGFISRLKIFQIISIDPGVSGADLVEI